MNLDIRKFRSLSPRQCEFLDACFGVGKYTGTGDGNRRLVLGGGAGFGGKSHTQRSGIVECAMRMAQAGVTKPRQLLVCQKMTELQERHIAEIPKDRNQLTGESNSILEFGELKRDVLGFFKLEFAGKYKPLGVVEFRHGGNLNDRKGSQYEAIWPDELTQFAREDFDAMLYMLRSSQSVPFLLFAGATNPDGPGNPWVKKLWVDSDFTGEPVGLKPGQFHFVPFTVYDNPIATEDSVQMLLSQGESLVKARFYGEWDLLTGSRFPMYNREIHGFDWDEFCEFYAPGYNMSVSEILSTEGLFSWYASMDYGTSVDSATAYAIHIQDVHKNIWTFAELWLPGMSLPRQARAIIEHEGDFGKHILMRLCDPALRGPDDYQGKSRLTMFLEEGLQLCEANNAREDGWAAMEHALYWESDDEGKLTRKPAWRIHNQCVECHNFLRNAPRDEIRPEDVSKKFKRDHAGDMMRYGMSHLVAPPSKEVNPREEQYGKTEYAKAAWL